MSFEECKRLVINGNVKAQYEIGIRYYLGMASDFEKESLDVALVWIKKSAKNGYSDAMISAGDYYRKDVQNNEEAFKWYKKAEKLGNLSVLPIIDLFYASGTCVEKD